MKTQNYRKEKGKVLFDSIDLEIIEALEKKDYQVLELADLLKIHPTSLKPHLTKLLNLGLIYAKLNNEDKINLTFNSKLEYQLIPMLKNANKIKRRFSDLINFDLRAKNNYIKK